MTERTFLLTTPEVAAMLRVSRSTVIRMLNRGDLTRVQLGAATRIRRDDVLALIERSAA